MLHLHRALRADGLVQALGELIVDPLDDPLAAEVIAVPTRGVERWLAQRLSTRLGALTGRQDGVCANVEFPSPARLVGRSVATASGVDRDRDPWLPERAVWPLLDVVQQYLGEPWLAPLAAHLGAEDRVRRRGGRFATVAHLADLYDTYGVHRPEMLCAWAAGADTTGDTTDGDETGGAPAADTAWQAPLWRCLRTRIAVPSPAERLAGACQRLRADPALVALPPRVSLFGLTRLPASYLQVLGALASGREVHLFLLHPSPALWSRVAEVMRDRPPVRRRVHDETAWLPRHPLLASWGRDSREMQVVLSGPSTAAVRHHHHGGPDRPITTLLQRIQADVRDDRAPPGMPLPGQPEARPDLDPADRSVQVHACHGLARQVEVVRDSILHALCDDPTMEARDVIVMCPDIETFAPLIDATFGAGEVDDDEVVAAGGPPDLRVRLADRSLRQTNPVLGVVAELLELASARLTASQVLDLAGREPVRRRFGFDDDELAQVQGWEMATGIRWGLDAPGRAPFKLAGVGANTWESGLDRVLLGVAMADEQQRLVGGVLPLDDVGSGDIDLAGRMAEFIDRLHSALGDLNGSGDLSGSMTVDRWAQAIAGAADALTTTRRRDSWQRHQLETLLDDVVVEATADHTIDSPSLTLPEIRSLLADRLRGRPTRANFRTGHLTICSLVPMRSVPHRVVCLLGLDEGVFPRKVARDGDDLLLTDPHIGDRDSRSEDRQLLLDALLAATDRLIITYAGRDERTNAERPPAVPVGELLDVIDRTVRTSSLASRRPDPGPWSLPAVVVHHPLQPFDPRNFGVGRLVPGRPWSFDPVALRGAEALSGDRTEAPAFLRGPLPNAPTQAVEVEQLVRFVQHPVKAFLRQRLGIFVGDYSDDVSDAMPVALDRLEQWGVGQRLLEARLRGADIERCVTAEVARGILPAGAFAQPILERVQPLVEDLVRAAEDLVGHGERGSVDIKVALDDRRSLVGTVPDVTGILVRTVTFSRVGPKHRLAAWVRFLALTAAYPERGYHAAMLGRVRTSGGAGRVTVSRLEAFEGDPDARRKVALHHLRDLVELYDRGLRQPLPLYCKTSAAHAETKAAGRDPGAAAKAAWESTWSYEKEDGELEHRLVLGGVATWADIVAAAPGEDEAGEGWAADESTRFGRYARRLWDGLLSCERLEDR